MSLPIEILKRFLKRPGRRAWKCFRVTALVAVFVIVATTVEGKLVSAASDGAQSTNGASKYSAGIGDILKMLDAGVPKDVLKAYIDNSPVAYRPGADEIIALHKRGVSSEIITALLHRGEEVRSKEAQVKRAAQSLPVRRVTAQLPTSYAPAEADALAPQPDYPAYSSAYSYPAYSYPTYWSYSYVSPYYYSSFYYPYFSYRYCYPYYGYRSCYPRSGYRYCYSPNNYRCNYPRYSYRSCSPRYGGFRSGYASTRYVGRVPHYRQGGIRTSYASARYSGGFAASRQGGGFAGRRR
jgi:hypothetical protein